MTGLMQGKRGLIMGLANEKSLAWGISKSLAEHGAELAFSYLGEALEKRVRPLAEQLGSDLCIPCDASDQASIDAAFAALGRALGQHRFPGPRDRLFGQERAARQICRHQPRQFPDDDERFSAYSLVAVTRAARPMMSAGGAILTLTYYGAEKVIPHYNVMGVAKAALESSVQYLAVDLGPENIRVNAISAGPIKTLAASGIGDFRYILKWNELNSPLRRNVTIEDVGGAGLYLLSDLASGVTGEVHHVDAGYHTIGMKAEDAPDIALDH